MLTYNFEVMKLISKDMGQFMSIDAYEKDAFTRRTQYPHVFLIKEDVYTYKNPDNSNNPITRTLITKRLKAPKGVLDRYLNWKPFGKGMNSEESKICEPVFIVPHNKLTQDVQTKSMTIASKGSYKPKINLNYSKQSNTISDTSKLYIPSSITLKKVNENTFSLIIKNFSKDFSKDDIENDLYNLFEQYGSIKRLNVLINKNTGQIKDIAFIDFHKQSDVNNILESNTRFILHNMILTVEKNSKTIIK